MSENDSPGWPGQRLGRPESGPGSIGGFLRRLAAITVDWAVSMILVLLIGIEYGTADYSWAVLAVCGAQLWLLTTFAGASVGQHLLGLGVIGLDGRSVPLHKALVRTVLLLLVFPAFIWDRDERGLHDKAVGTVVVRTR